MKVVTGPDNFREERLAQLIEQYEKDLLRMCCVFVRDIAMAEDAVQETFLKAYRAMDDFRGESSEKTWLMTIARNVCRDMHRNAWFRLVDRKVDLDALQIPVESVSETKLALMQEIIRLPKRYREVILLYYYEDLKLKEIAKMLGVSEMAVSKRLKKARDMLKPVLEGGMDDEA